MADVSVQPRLPEVGSTTMTKLEEHLFKRESPTFTAYYNGKMSFVLHGTKWKEYVTAAFADLASMTTSENIYKSVIDLYAENLVPVPEELRGFSNVLVPLLSRGECIVVVDSANTPHFPEHFEVASDGNFTVAAVFTRSLEKMEDYVTFVYSDGRSRMFKKAVPDDLAAAEKTGYVFGEEETVTLFRFALDDKGFGASLAALQDRINHSIIDQTVVAEMYARPFWYLLNVELPPNNPYLANQPESDALKEHKTDASATGRVFTSSSVGPFGQLDPPTISDMIAYHDSISAKVSTGTGVPQFYFNPGVGVPPTGVALKVLSKRFNNKIARMREDIEPTLKELAELLGIEKTKEVAAPVATTDEEGNPDAQQENAKIEYEYEFWPSGDDLLQEALDAHGISLSQMGYPLAYIAEVVTPGVDLDDYEETPDPTVDKSQLGVPTDMTATGQTGLPATPGQVASYAASPGQRAKPKASA